MLAPDVVRIRHPIGNEITFPRLHAGEFIEKW
jgi:hypothetical protein